MSKGEAPLKLINIGFGSLVSAGRLEKAKIEFKEIPSYDYLVINDKVSGAVAEIEAILKAAECRVENRKSILAQFA